MFDSVFCYMQVNKGLLNNIKTNFILQVNLRFQPDYSPITIIMFSSFVFNK